MIHNLHICWSSGYFIGQVRPEGMKSWRDVTGRCKTAEARSAQDEKHLCPLQLDVIDRALVMWSNEGDVVLSPFMGIGSEGYESVKMRRRFIGVELKEAYWRQACQNLQAAGNQGDLFSVPDESA